MGTKTVVSCAMRDNWLCYLNGRAIASAVASIAAKPNDSIMKWHARLGHINVEDVMMIENRDLKEGYTSLTRSEATLDMSQMESNKKSHSAKIHFRVSAYGREWRRNWSWCQHERQGTRLLRYQSPFYFVEYASSYGELYLMYAKPQWFPLLN